MSVAAGPGQRPTFIPNPYLDYWSSVVTATGPLEFFREKITPVGSPVIGENYGRARLTVDRRADGRQLALNFFTEGRDFLPGINNGFGGAGIEVWWRNVTVDEPMNLVVSGGGPTSSSLPGVPWGDLFASPVELATAYRNPATGSFTVAQGLPTWTLGPGFIYEFRIIVRGGNNRGDLGYSATSWTPTLTLVPVPGPGGLGVFALAAVGAARRRR